MPYKIQELTEELYQELLQLWGETQGLRPDADRAEGILEFLLLHIDSDAQLYKISDGEFFILRQIVPTMGADFFPLPTPRSDPRNYRRAIAEAMREYDLRRLNCYLPAPATETIGAVKSCGFVWEGKLKDATIYDGRYAGLVILGFYRDKVEKGLSLTGPGGEVSGEKKTRKRRSRRKKGRFEKEIVLAGAGREKKESKVDAQTHEE